MELNKTVGYDLMRKDGAKVLHKTLLKSHGQMIDEDIRQDLDYLMNEMAKGITLGSGKLAETVGLVRLVGYLQELSAVIGAMPAFGFTFHITDAGTLSIVFDPKRLDSGPPGIGMARLDTPKPMLKGDR